MHMENLLEILEQAPLEECRSAAILTADLYKKMAPYFECGVSTEQEELDFCGMVDLTLDEGGLTDQKARSEVLSKIYNATGFPQLYKG